MAEGRFRYSYKVGPKPTVPDSFIPKTPPDHGKKLFYAIAIFLAICIGLYLIKNGYI